MTSASKLFSVKVTCDEVVAERGTCTTQWLVRDGAQWLAAHRFPNAKSERLAAGPGTVWAEVVELELPAGALLRRVVSEPAAHKHKAPFDYLRGEVRGASRAKREQEYIVDLKGNLQRRPAAPPTNTKK